MAFFNIVFAMFFRVKILNIKCCYSDRPIQQGNLHLYTMKYISCCIGIAPLRKIQSQHGLSQSPSRRRPTSPHAARSRPEKQTESSEREKTLLASQIYCTSSNKKQFLIFATIVQFKTQIYQYRPGFSVRKEGVASKCV